MTPRIAGLAALALIQTIAVSQTAAAGAGADALVTGLRGGWTQADGSQMAALQMRMTPGWHTYWRAPGDAGIPPEFDWSGSRNVASVRIHWPRPRVFDLGGAQSIGYTGDLILPLEIVPKDPEQPVHLGARVDVGVCDEICVPASFRIDADLPRPGTEDPGIRTALRQRPSTRDEAGVTEVACTLAPTADGLRVTARLTLPDTGGPEVVVLESGAPGLYVTPATVKRNGPTLTAVADVSSGNGAPLALTRDAIVLTVLGTRRAVEITGCPAG